jgi:hypothetical protein
MTTTETIALAGLGAVAALLLRELSRGEARLDNPGPADAPPGCERAGIRRSGGKCDRCGRKLKRQATILQCRGVTAYCGPTCAGKWVNPDIEPVPPSPYDSRGFYSEPAYPIDPIPVWLQGVENPGCCYMTHPDQWTQPGGQGNVREQFRTLAQSMNYKSRFSSAKTEKVLGGIKASKRKAFDECRQYCDLAMIDGDGRRGREDVIIVPEGKLGKAPRRYLVFDRHGYIPEEGRGRLSAILRPHRVRGWDVLDGWSDRFLFAFENDADALDFVQQYARDPQTSVYRETQARRRSAEVESIDDFEVPF